MAQKKRSRSRPQPSYKRTAKEKLSEELDLPLASMPGMPNIELAGNRQAVVEGCKGVLEYNENAIKLNLGKSIVKFVGIGLSMTSFRFEQAVISGNILSVEFL
ncbi:MAG: sporulation protein [Clostridiales bacterium]|jgi:sporulation protein YqfC|nr:sporulation protein [Clostridiales bacterium]